MTRRSAARPSATNAALVGALVGALIGASGLAGCGGAAAGVGATAGTLPQPTRTSAEVLAQSAPGDWRPVDPARMMVMELAGGRVVVELAPAFAPGHVGNVMTLTRAGYFDGLAIVRVQDNYVVQWGDADGKRDLGAIVRKLPDEYSVEAARVPFTALPDGDVYAPQVGWSEGFPVGRDAGGERAWIAHCYGVVGVGRDMPPDNGSGAELYVVSGHAPRHLDRNLAMVGRVLQGMEVLTSLPRGTGPLGFYEQPAQRVPITRVRIAADLPEAERPRLEVLRTDTATFAAYVAARRVRREGFFVEPTGRVELCNVAVPTRAISPAAN